MSAWAKASRICASLHTELGVSAVLLHTADELYTKSPGSYVIMGGPTRVLPHRELRVKKDIRQFIWEAGQHPLFKDPLAVLWTAFADGNSTIGLGTLSPVPVGENYVRLGGAE
jgi:hypothetical protein